MHFISLLPTEVTNTTESSGSIPKFNSHIHAFSLPQSVQTVTSDCNISTHFSNQKRRKGRRRTWIPLNDKKTDILLLLAQNLPFVMSDLSFIQPPTLQTMEERSRESNKNMQLHICDPEFIVTIYNETSCQSFRSTCMQGIHDKGFTMRSWTELILQYNDYYTHYCVLISN